jgi:hypothetical protein
LPGAASYRIGWRSSWTQYPEAIVGQPGAKVLQMSRKQNVKKPDAEISTPIYPAPRDILRAIRAATKLIYAFEHPMRAERFEDILLNGERLPKKTLEHWRRENARQNLAVANDLRYAVGFVEAGWDELLLDLNTGPSIFLARTKEGYVFQQWTGWNVATLADFLRDVFALLYWYKNLRSQPLAKDVADTIRKRLELFAHDVQKLDDEQQRLIASGLDRRRRARAAGMTRRTLTDRQIDDAVQAIRSSIQNGLSKDDACKQLAATYAVHFSTLKRYHDRATG